MPMPISFLDWIDTRRVFKGNIPGNNTDGSGAASGDTTPRNDASNSLPADATVAEKAEVSDEKIRLFRPRIFAMALVVSIGGLIFGYDVRIASCHTTR